jgi:hypothetical protein
MDVSSPGIEGVVIDGHVHLRDEADDAAALAAAVRNFSALAPGARAGVLMMAEAHGEQGFARLRRGVANGSAPWRGTLTAEPESLWLEVQGWRLLIVAGRQLVTAERLEVLALATARPFADGRTLDDSLDEIAAADGLPVLPWGCGKWLGRRRRILTTALRAGQSRGLLLGDNAGRPALWPEPLFRGRRVLRGTDPLPLPGHCGRIGSFASVLAIMLSLDRPAADLRRALRDVSVSLEQRGRLQRPARFALDQLRLRGLRAPATMTGEPAR